MFHAFESLKKESKIKTEKFSSFNIVLSGSGLLYIEGHKGLYKLEKDIIVLKLKNCILSVKGNELYVQDLKKDTMIIKGEIKNIDLI